MPIKIVHGDLIKMAQSGAFDVIAHGCNCFNTMGSGIAKSMKWAFPAAYKADCETIRGDIAKLGTCSHAECKANESGVVVDVINAYTQFNYGGNKANVDYGAVITCMKWIKNNYHGKRIGLPKIGAGLGGGRATHPFDIFRIQLDSLFMHSPPFGPYAAQWLRSAAALGRAWILLGSKKNSRPEKFW